MTVSLDLKFLLEGKSHKTDKNCTLLLLRVMLKIGNWSPLLTPLVSCKVLKFQENKNLLILGKWHCHQARLTVAKILQRIALTQASMTENKQF
jgi:hypothetical protein